MGVKLGHEVGYSIRFEDNTTDKTIIELDMGGRCVFSCLEFILRNDDLGSINCRIKRVLNKTFSAFLPSPIGNSAVSLIRCNNIQNPSDISALFLTFLNAL